MYVCMSHNMNLINTILTRNRTMMPIAQWNEIGAGSFQVLGSNLDYISVETKTKQMTYSSIY